MAKKDAKEAGENPDEARVTFTLRVPKYIMAALEGWCAGQRFPPTKQSVIESLLVEFLDNQKVPFRPHELLIASQQRGLFDDESEEGDTGSAAPRPDPPK